MKITSRLYVSGLLTGLLLSVHSTSFARTESSVDHESFLRVSSPASIANTGKSTTDTTAVNAADRDVHAGKTGFVNSSSSHAAAVSTVSEAVAGASEQSRAVEKNDPDWSGIWRDAGTFLGTQFVAVGIIYTTPERFSGWTSQQKKDTFSHYSENVQRLVLDKDKFYINYLLHPYWGGTYYTRGRERGLDETSSLVYSALMSAMYEFGPECFFEKPSIQDLIVTPLVGSLLGAYVFEPWRNSIKRKQELRWYDHALLIATDPLGVLSLGVEKVLGIKSTIMVDYSIPQFRSDYTGSTVASQNNRIGVVVQVPFN